MVYIALFAALVSFVSASVAFMSLKTAKLALNKKYQIFTACDFDLGGYDKVNQYYGTVVTFYNLGEVTVLMEVELKGVIDFPHANPFNISTTKHRLIIKGGESKTATIQLITGGVNGDAKIEVYARLENGMQKNTSISYPLAKMSV